MMQKPSKISPARARYIKLGEGGAWEKECLSQNFIRFSFGTGLPELYPLCMNGAWEQAKAVWAADGHGPGPATRFANV